MGARDQRARGQAGHTTRGHTHKQNRPSPPSLRADLRILEGAPGVHLILVETRPEWPDTPYWRADTRARGF